MSFQKASAIFITALFPAIIFAQTETYIVEKAFFSTDKYDEFAPFCYKNGVVYCSNKPSVKLMSYANEDNRGFFKITYSDTLLGPLQSPKFLSKRLNSKFNDGPVSINGKGDTIFFSRNLIVDGKLSEISSNRNKLGIFYAVYDGEDWNKVRELRINNEWYNVTAPCLSTDGKRLYFSSDKPGGYGGSDLYYSQWKNDYWDDPVNMGPTINTKGNESYPFMNAAGEFFFSSDGHQGYGGKDIFFTYYSDTAWIKPVCLDPPLNSKADDFGIYTDSLMTMGYFSSNRDKSVDVFHFKTLFPQMFYTSAMKKNNYCLLFSDSGSIAVDTTNLEYRWSFGDGKTDEGVVATHCFPGPGTYRVVLDIVERSTGKVFFNKLSDDIVIQDFKQGYINAPDNVVKGEKVKLDGTRSYLPGYRILSYAWDFGDKNRDKGAEVSHTFNAAGDYVVNLEMALKADSTGRIKKTGVSRSIKVFNSVAEKNSYTGSSAVENRNIADFRNSENANLSVRYSAEDEFKGDAIFKVQLISSKTKLDMGGYNFKSIPSIYTVKEKFDPKEGVYSYTVDHYINLMSAYPTYAKMVSLGFSEAKVIMVPVTDPAEKELFTLLRINGTSTDGYFDYSDRLTSTAFIMLDQVVKLMNKYPTLRLEIGVYTDYTGKPETSQLISQKRAQSLVEYLVNRGVSLRRVVPVGYGSSKPVASNITEKDRKLNRRFDLSILAR